MVVQLDLVILVLMVQPIQVVVVVLVALAAVKAAVVDQVLLFLAYQLQITVVLQLVAHQYPQADQTQL